MRAALGTRYDARLTSLTEVAERQDRGGPVEYLPVLAPDGEADAISSRAIFDYFGTARGAVPGWENRLSAWSERELLVIDLFSPVAFVAPTPAIVVHGDRDPHCPPAAVQVLFDRLGEPKRIVWVPSASHTDLYDDDRCVALAVGAVATYLVEHLSVPAGAR